MNANELADALQYVSCESGDEKILMAVDTMLRQLQAENEKLKDEVAEWKMSYENCHRMCNEYGMN